MVLQLVLLHELFANADETSGGINTNDLVEITAHFDGCATYAASYVQNTDRGKKSL